MSILKGFLAPFSLIWKYSNSLAPARDVLGEGEHWSNYVCAALYVVVLFGVLLFLAIHLSTEFVFTLLAIAATLVVVKYAWYYFF